MTEPIPKWIQRRYATLWQKFAENEFSYDQAVFILKDSKGINMFLSDLKKAGWIEIKLDPKDSRRRIYSLKSPIEVFNNMEI